MSLYVNEKDEEPETKCEVMEENSVDFRRDKKPLPRYMQPTLLSQSIILSF